MRLTDKQIKTLTCIAKGNPDGSIIDLDQILDNLAEKYDWVTSKASLIFTLRILTERGFIEKLGTECRRGRNRRLFKIRELGMQMLGPGVAL